VYAHTLHVCVQNQQAAAHWHDNAMHWAMRANWPTNQASRRLAAFFAHQYQQDAARLYRADRVLRGLEA
jgi:hypothetical protein